MATIKLRDRELPILFSLNIVEKIQKKYGNIEDLAEKIQTVSECRWIIAIIVNEAIEYNNFISGKNDKLYTEQQIGFLLGATALSDQATAQSIIDAFNESVSDEKKMTAEQILSMQTMHQNQ